MQDDILKQYATINKKIQLSEELKKDTVRLMKEEKPERKYAAFTYAAAVLAGVAVLGTIAFQIRLRMGSHIVIKDTLVENTVQEQVELSKGNMYFQKLSGEFSAPGLSLGMLDGKQVSIKEEDYFTYLGQDPLPSYLPKGMVKQDSGEQILTLNEDGTYQTDIFHVKYEGEKESTLDISLSGLKIPEEENVEELAATMVNGVEVKLAYYGAEPETRVFLGYFQIDEIGCKVKGYGISQEEFIKVILSMITK